MNRSRVTLALCVLLLAGGACKKPPPKTVDPLELLPSTAAAAVWGPSLGDAVDGVAALLNKLEKPGTQEGYRAVVTSLFGVDLSTREGLAQAGLQATAPFGVALDQDGATWVLPASDAAGFLARMDKLAREREGADRVSDPVLNGTTVHQLARPFGTREVPVLCTVHKAQHVIVATGKGCATRAAAAAQTTPETSMAAVAQVSVARARLPAAPILFVGNPERAAAVAAQAASAAKLVRHAAGTIVPTAKGLSVQVWTVMDPARLDGVLRSLFPPGEPLPLQAVLEEDVLAAGQGALAWAAAQETANAVDPNALPGVRKQLGRIGLDLEDGVMSLTDGHLAFGLYTLEAAQWATLLRQGLDVHHQLLRVLPFVALLRPGPGHTVAELKERISQRLTARKMTVAARPNDADVLVASDASGETWRQWYVAHVGNVVLVGGGIPDRFDRALARLRTPQAQPVALDPQLQAPRTDRLLVRLDAAGARAQQLIGQDLGTGAEAVMLQNLLRKIRSQTALLQALRVTATPLADGVKVDVDVTVGERAP